MHTSGDLVSLSEGGTSLSYCGTVWLYKGFSELWNRCDDGCGHIFAIMYNQERRRAGFHREIPRDEMDDCDVSLPK